MSYPKLLQTPGERTRPVTVYLGRKGFESGVTRHLRHADAPAWAHAVLHLRLSSHDSVRTHLGPLAACKLLHNAAAILLRSSHTVAAAYLEDATFAVLMSELEPVDAVLHADHLTHSISRSRVHHGDVVLCSDAFSGLATADSCQDAAGLLAMAEEAGHLAEKKHCAKLRAELADGAVPKAELEEPSFLSWLMPEPEQDDPGFAAFATG